MWALVYIRLLFPMEGVYEVDSQMLGTYKQFAQCFKERENFIVEQTNQLDGYPKPNTQVVCIRMEK